MKSLPVFFLIFAAWMSNANGTPTEKFAFERGDDLWIANTDGTGAKKITKGQSPDLSPDGTKLVYETIQSDNNKPTPRHLIVLDLASEKSTTLDTQHQNVMDPLWSPDGKQIVLISIDADSHAHINLINADGTGFHTLDAATPKQDYWDANWAADGQSLFAQDFENIYQLDLDGKVLKKWAIAKLAPNGSMSSDCNLNPSPDGKMLLMDVEMNEEARKGWDGPPPAIWIMDLTTEKCTRLTPPKFYAWSSRWLKAPDSILYVSQKIDEADSAIYRMSATGNGADSKRIMKNASFPSLAR